MLYKCMKCGATRVLTRILGMGLPKKVSCPMPDCDGICKMQFD